MGFMLPAAPEAVSVSTITAADSNRTTGFRSVALALTAGRDSRRLAALICLLALCAVAGAAACIGAVRTFYYGYDIFVPLDGAWRFICGQRAHIDFYSCWGPLQYIVFGAGLMLAGNSINGFGYGLALAALTLGISTWVVCRRRMFPVPAILASIAVALLTAAPFPLGLRPTTLSHAMSYNRWGFALIGIVLLEAFSSPADRRDALVGGLIAGACCAAALFVKASYFLVGATVIAVSMLVARQRPRLVGIAAGAAAVSLVIVSYLHFDLRAMFTDLAIAGAARKNGMSLWGLRWAVLDELPSFLPLLAAAILLAFDPWRRRGESLAVQYSPLLASVLVLFGGALLMFSNAQIGGFPMIMLFALVISNEALRRSLGTMQAAPYYCAIVAIAGVSFLPGFTADAAGTAYGLIQRVRPLPSNVARFHSAQLSKLVLMDVPDGRDWETRSNGANYVEYINDAVDLIQKNSLPSESAMAFDTIDPLPYALLRKPPEGGYIAMAIDNSYSDEKKPSPERLFGNVDIVMYPKYPAGAEVHWQALRRNYEPYLRSHFSQCAESSRWLLFRRRDSFGCNSQR
jgi:hypothetical protein